MDREVCNHNKLLDEKCIECDIEASAIYSRGWNQAIEEARKRILELEHECKCNGGIIEKHYKCDGCQANAGRKEFASQLEKLKRN